MISDIPPVLRANDQNLQNALTFISKVPKAQYLLFSTIFELEAPVIEALKPKFPFSLYSIGPLIPFNDLEKTSANHYPEYLEWLDSQTQRSVIYVSLGSFLSVTSAQMDDIVAGLCGSGVKFLLVARDKALALEKEVEREIGMVVPWCDQLRVLCHPSIGGFWTHFGWNSTMESAFSGVPMIGFPISMDQPTVSKMVAEDWKVGWKLKEAEHGSECLVRREDVADLVKRFMDPENDEKKEMTKRAIQIQEICRGTIRDGGSSEYNLDAFIHSLVSSKGSGQDDEN